MKYIKKKEFTGIDTRQKQKLAAPFALTAI